jgi:NAD(P)-dependent dehydrogenase (short-subunit alcohol dehydrogenase family)
MANIETKDEQLLDPRERGPKPPFPQERTTPPGSDQELQPRADHGEQTYKGHGRLKGRVALITGGDSGIGRAVAIAYAREGADILISYLNEDEDAAETAKWVKDAGRRVATVPGDIGDERHCIELVERTRSEFGSVDLLVNNAAFQMSHEKIQEFSSEEWRQTFATNIDAMFYLCKAALPNMKPGSAIINTASVNAFQPSPGLLAYATTKGAIVTFTRALSQMALEQGVRVNAVAPGPVWTPLIPWSMPEEKVKKFGQSSPMSRPAQPAELAPLYVFLASNDSSYCTGAVFDITGGELLP